MSTAVPEQKIYHLNYFSSPQTRVYFDNVWVDDCVYLERTISQNKRAIYGYSSQYFDYVAPGTVIVTGSFSVNYRYENFLSALLNYSKGLSQVQGRTDENYRSRIGSLITETATNNPFSATPSKIGNIQGGPISTSLSTNKDGYMVDRTQILKNNRQGLSNQGNQNRSLEYEFYNDDKIRDLEEQFWNNAQSQANANQSNALSLNPDRLPPFNILITYGDTYEDALSNQDTSAVVEKIYGVHITSWGSTVGVSGDPITQDFSFIAQKVI